MPSGAATADGACGLSSAVRSPPPSRKAKPCEGGQEAASAGAGFEPTGPREAQVHGRGRASPSRPGPVPADAPRVFSLQANSGSPGLEARDCSLRSRTLRQENRHSSRPTWTTRRDPVLPCYLASPGPRASSRRTCRCSQNYVPASPARLAAQGWSPLGRTARSAASTAPRERAQQLAASLPWAVGASAHSLFKKTAGSTVFVN